MVMDTAIMATAITGMEALMDTRVMEAPMATAITGMEVPMDTRVDTATTMDTEIITAATGGRAWVAWAGVA
jgi:hypothetical protein